MRGCLTGDDGRPRGRWRGAHRGAGAFARAALLLLFPIALPAGLAPHAVPAPLRVTHASLGSGGGWASAGGLANLSDLGRTGACTYEFELQSRGGFVAGMLWEPATDTDSDGIVDEWDPDNDNDGLNDATELQTGGAEGLGRSDPQRADSDQDGMSDRAERIAGTDPLDAAASLRISRLETGAEGVGIEWIGRAGSTYQIEAMGAAAGGAAAVEALAIITAPGTGAGPWRVVTNRFVDTRAPSSRVFYRVSIIPQADP